MCKKFSCEADHAIRAHCMDLLRSVVVVLVFAVGLVGVCSSLRRVAPNRLKVFVCIKLFF